MTKTRRFKGQAEGYRSGLEDEVASQIKSRGLSVVYESKASKVSYTQPAKARTYTPDFVLPNGIIIETKGRFVTADRQKHLLIRAQRPELDIRFVFSRSKGRISKLSQTTYADWCRKYGFPYADLRIPEEWFNG